jgi:hypothetical protein
MATNITRPEPGHGHGAAVPPEIETEGECPPCSSAAYSVTRCSAPTGRGFLVQSGSGALFPPLPPAFGERPWRSDPRRAGRSSVDGVRRGGRLILSSSAAGARSFPDVPDRANFADALLMIVDLHTHYPMHILAGGARACGRSRPPFPPRLARLQRLILRIATKPRTINDGREPAVTGRRPRTVPSGWRSRSVPALRR